MSFVRCRRIGCPHHVRTGLVRSGEGKADGRFCWRCRRKFNQPMGRRPEEKSKMTSQDEKRAPLYQKFVVKRADDSTDPGGKHEHCEFFVLDWQHDPYAPVAARAYATACEAEYPALAASLRALADKYQCVHDWERTSSEVESVALRTARHHEQCRRCKATQSYIGQAYGPDPNDPDPFS